jgi:hypothetical protein
MANTKKNQKSRPKQKKEKELLNEHPEVTRNAQDYFNHENGETIIQDRVPRGDADPYSSPMPMNQGDLSNDDLRGLAVYAKDIMDPVLYRYDEKTAARDALTRAIHEKDGGIYSSRLNTNTFDLVLGYMEEDLPKTKMSKDIDFGQSDNEKYSGNGKNSDWRVAKKANEYLETKFSADMGPGSGSPVQPEEVTMSRSDEIKALEEKLAALRVEEENKDLTQIAEKVATDPKTRDLFKQLMKQAANKKDDKDEKSGCGTKYSGKDQDDDDKAKRGGMKYSGEDSADEEDAKEESGKESEASIISELDKLAGDLESKGDFELFKVAYQIDMVSDVLQGKKDASTLQNDPDEKFMRQYFEAGKREGDSDENKYMNEFNTDNTKEVAGVAGKKSKTASTKKRAYSIIRED